MLRVAARCVARTSRLALLSKAAVAEPTMCWRGRSLCTKDVDAAKNAGGDAQVSGKAAPDAFNLAALDDWIKNYDSGNSPPLRYPVGTPVQCFVGTDRWVKGTVVKHNYREESWPAGKSVPYQILLADEELKEKDGRNAIWAPADLPFIIRAAFRFELSDSAECRLDRDEYAKCTVVGLLYRETSWPEGRYAPYQVKVEAMLPGALSEQAKSVVGKLIWLPDDDEEYIRRPCATREARLAALAQLSGSLSEAEYADKRREVVHSAAAPQRSAAASLNIK